MAIEAGTRLGSHEIIGLLGAGGMGEVYLAQDTKLNRQVAIKVLPGAYATDPERVARFQREAQAVAALNHPNIAAIYELAEANDIKFLVLELVEGDTLAARLGSPDTSHQPPRFSVEEALAIAKQLLEALEAAHERGICHRDLKPANVKLTPDGAVKVLDFGLAKFLQTTPTVGNLTHSPTLTLANTFPGVILGTAGYMSPEQAKGYEADQRSDIFSFGCILYELLTGRQAFDGETASEILASVLKIDVDFAPLPQNLNPRLKEVLRRCLEKNPKKRWHAAADVRIEIESAMSRALVMDEPRAAVAAVATAPRPFWRRALPVAAAVTVTGLVIGYGAWTLKPEPKRAVTRFEVSLPDGQPFTATGRRLLALSPDGTNLVYVAKQRLYLRPMAGFDSREVAGTNLGSPVAGPAFSPDGQSLAFAAVAERTLKRIAVSGGAAVTLCPVEPVWGMSWDATGIVFGQLGKGILRVSPNGGTPQVIAAVEPDYFASSPQMLPGGKSVVFALKKGTDTWDKGQIVVQSLATGQRKVIVEGGADPRYLGTGHLVYALSGVVLAVPFDAARGEVTGGPVPVVEGVQRTSINPNGTGEAHLAFATNGSMAYVPGPVKVAAAAGGQDLALFDRKGGAQALKLPPGTYRAPRVSSDGKIVAFESEDANEVVVALYDLAGTSAMRRLTFGGQNRAPVWSPDGQWIAFQSDREGDQAIFRQRADGSGTAERLTKPEAGVVHTPQSWSPDGAQLLISVLKDREYTLSTLTLKDRRMSPFGNVRSEQPTEASFSPDGKWVAYQSADPGKVRQIFVQPFPATGAKYLVPAGPATNGTGIGHPYWNRKGAELIMNAAPTISYSVSFTATPRVEFGPPASFPRLGRVEPNPATGRRGADALPDGEHVIGIGAAGSGSASGLAPQFNVVLNWFDEVKQKVPGT
jgi:eukaryotic-like serine/threonine-protein kinase